MFTNVSWATENTLKCSYIFDGKSYPLEYERVGNKLVEKTPTRMIGTHNILLDNNDVLIFGSPVYDGGPYGYQISIISKKSRELVTRVLDEAFAEQDGRNPAVYGACFFR